MNSVLTLREGLRKYVPDSLYPMPPEDAFEGIESAVSVWTSPGENAKTRPLSEAPPGGEHEHGNEESSESGKRALEEILEINAPADAEQARAALGGDAGIRIRRSTMLKGIDALGAYLSFHYIGVQWGIYVRASGVYELAANAFRELDIDFNTKLRLAFRVIHQHELFHFGFDYALAQLELYQCQAIHKPVRKGLREPHLGYIAQEEALANAHMIRAFRRGPVDLRPRGCATAIRLIVATQPEGYRDGYRYESLEQFQLGFEDLLDRHHSDPKGHELHHVNLYALAPSWPSVESSLCPTHIIHDEDEFSLPRLNLELFLRIEGISETKQFQKSLKKLPKNIRRSWDKQKRQIAESTRANGMDFKKWERIGNDQVWSIKLSGNHRAHLRHDEATDAWFAENVGSHGAMGHG